MRSPRFRSLSNERGAAAVEFAIISTILFLLIFGIFEFGRVYSRYQVLQGAAREGARHAAVAQDSGIALGEVRARVVNAADPYSVSATSVSMSTNCAIRDANGRRVNVGQEVTVSWPETLTFNIPFMPPMSVERPIRGVFRCE